MDQTDYVRGVQGAQTISGSGENLLETQVTTPHSPDKSSIVKTGSMLHSGQALRSTEYGVHTVLQSAPCRQDD